MGNLEPREAMLNVEKRYLTWKHDDGTNQDYYAPPGVIVIITGVTVDATAYGYPTEPLYWANFGGFQFGVTRGEFEWWEE